MQKQLYYFNYSYITYITATENNLQYSYIYSLRFLFFTNTYVTVQYNI